MMQYKLCDNPWGKEELAAIQAVMETGMYTMGEQVCQYEQEFAQKFGAPYAVMVSSGSTANLLAIAALVYANRLPRGSEIIVPAVSWSTTYTPLEQYGMKLVFVDIDKDTLNISVDALKHAITDKTRMIFLVNLLGNPNCFEEIFALCEGRNILILEDNCESMGATYHGKQLGTLGLMGTYSTFYSHHMCTMEGGVVVTGDRELYEYMLAIRAHGWTRNLPEGSFIYQKKDNPFYESFNFIVPGYNLRPLEMEGAIGRVQLKKISGMIEQRRKNAEHFRQKVRNLPGIRLQKEVEQSSWFGFSIVLEGELAQQRDEIVEKLRQANIEVRPIVAGNFTRNKVIEYMDYSIPAPLVNADDIHDHGFFVGNHSHDNSAEIDYFVQVMEEILERGKIHG